MNTWTRRIRGAFGMGLVWAVAWGGVGGVIELLANLFPDAMSWTSVVDMWIQLLAINGFLSGAIFSVLLGIAARRRRFNELSVPQFALWGALGGLMLAVLLGAGPAAVGVLTALSTGAAAGTLAIARKAEQPELAAGPGAPERLGKG